MPTGRGPSRTSAQFAGKPRIKGVHEMRLHFAVTIVLFAAACGGSKYDRSSWGNKAAAVTPEMVAHERAATADQQGPWSADQLQPLIR